MAKTGVLRRGQLLALAAGLTALVADCGATARAAQNPTPTPSEAQGAALTLSGQVDRKLYRDIAFQVPPGARKAVITIDYTGHDKGAVLTFSVSDPQRARGWNGGLKSHIVIGEDFASPGFLAGPLPAGRWTLGLGVANIHPGQVSTYTVAIRFETTADPDAITETAVRAGPGWYRGDLHVHTGHSDGYCANPAGRPAPCPLFLTLQAALDHHLDFVAVTDHNVTSQYAEMADLTGYFDTLLLIPGREVTTQEGHFNLIGATRPVDVRVGASPSRTLNDVLHEAAATGGLVIINHPEIPTGEDCLGCGWSPRDTDFASVAAIEIANGGIAADHHGFPEGQGSGLGFWERQLDLGRRVTGTGGSDNHNALIERQPVSPVGPQSPVGTPATVVYADALSQAAILRGLRAGRVFVDLENRPGRILDLTASSGGSSATMGGVLTRPCGAAMVAHVHAAGLEGDTVELVADGRPLGRSSVSGPDQTVELPLKPQPPVRWVRVDARDVQGRRVAISNPVYLQPPGGRTASSKCNAANIR